MESLRQNALNGLLASPRSHEVDSSRKITGFFAENVFDLKKALLFQSGFC